jgi:hypothetical protein
MLLRRQLAENDEGVQEQRRFIAGQDQEKRRIHQRFDEELRSCGRCGLPSAPYRRCRCPRP